MIDYIRTVGRSGIQTESLKFNDSTSLIATNSISLGEKVIACEPAQAYLWSAERSKFWGGSKEKYVNFPMIIAFSVRRKKSAQHEEGPAFSD